MKRGAGKERDQDDDLSIDLEPNTKNRIIDTIDGERAIGDTEAKTTGPDLVTALGRPPVANIVNFLNDFDLLSFAFTHPKHYLVTNIFAINRLLRTQSLESIQQHCKLSNISPVELMTQQMINKLDIYFDGLIKIFIDDAAALMDYDLIEVPEELKPIIELITPKLENTFGHLDIDNQLRIKVMQFCCLITAIGMTGIGFSCLPLSLKENFIPFFQELVAIVHGQEVKDCDLGEEQGLKERKESIYSAAFELALSLGHDSVAAKLLTDKQNGLVSFNETPHMNFKQLLSQQHYSIVALLLMLYRKKSLEDFSSTLRSLQLDGFDFNEHSKLVLEHVPRFLGCNNQDPANTLRLLECAASLGCLDEASAIASTLESDSALDIQQIYNFAFEMACSRDDLSMAQKLLPCVLAQLKQNPIGNQDWVLRCGFSENVCPVVLKLAQRCGQLDAVLEHAINTQNTFLLSKLLCAYSKHIPAHVIEKAIYTAIDLPGLRIDTLGTLLYHTCKHMSAVAFDEFTEYAQNHNPFIPMCLENYKRVREHEEAIPHVYVPAYHQGRKRVRQSEVKELQKEAEEFKKKRESP